MKACAIFHNVTTMCKVKQATCTSSFHLPKNLITVTNTLIQHAKPSNALAKALNHPKMLKPLNLRAKVFNLYAKPLNQHKSTKIL